MSAWSAARRLKEFFNLWEIAGKGMNFFPAVYGFLSSFIASSDNPAQRELSGDHSIIDTRISAGLQPQAYEFITYLYLGVFLLGLLLVVRWKNQIRRGGGYAIPHLEAAVERRRFRNLSLVAVWCSFLSVGVAMFIFWMRYHTYLQEVGAVRGIFDEGFAVHLIGVIIASVFVFYAWAWNLLPMAVRPTLPFWWQLRKFATNT